MSEQKQIFPRDGFPKKTLELSGRPAHNLFTYQARESSLVPAGFLTAQFLQKL